MGRRDLTPRVGLVVALACAATTTWGCGALARDVARESTPGVIEGAVRGVNTPGLQRDLAKSHPGDPTRVIQEAEARR